MMQCKTSRYTNYTYSDFLRDDYFIVSHITPTSYSQEYWNLLVQEPLICIDEYEKAKEILLNFNTSQKIHVDSKQLEGLWLRINKTNRRLDKKKYAAIACFVAVAVLMLIFILPSISKPERAVSLLNQVALVDTNLINASRHIAEISLITPNESEIFLSKDSKLDYSRNLNSQTSSSNYTHIVVPYGQTTRLILSDKTKLYIKPGTHVFFPTKFSGDTREIYVDGEVYAEVETNPQKPFKIINRSIEMTVLGTKFRFRAYEKDEAKSIVLVSGKVAVNLPNEEAQILSPNERFLLERNQVM